MVDVSEVVVRATPEGMDNVVSKTNEMEGAVEDSTEEMDEQAGTMSDLSEKFAGAMSVAVTGLAVAAGGLLAQVPVLGEAFSGLFAIVDAVAFQMDQVLRPVLMPITNLFFAISDAIFEADGAMGDVIGVGATLAAILGMIVGPALLVASKLGLIGSVSGAVIAAGKFLIGVLAAIASAISLPIAAAALLVAGLAVLAYHFREEIANAIGTAVAFLKDFATRAKQAANDVVKRITGAFTSLVDKAKDWGKSLIEKLVKGIKSAAGAVQDIVEGINLTAGVTIGDVAGTAGEIAGAASDAGSDFIGSVGSEATSVFLDGSKVDNNQGRYRKDALARRGG
jgi:phage-related protein